MKKMTETELDYMYDKIERIIVSELKEYSFVPSHIEILGCSKGVKGDKGLHGWTVAFGATYPDKGNILYLPWGLLKKIEQRITGEIQEVSRVLYEIQYE